MIKWYYVTRQKTHQEFAEGEVEELLRTGTLQPGTLVWNDTMADWKPAREVQPEWFTSTDTGTPPLAAAASEEPGTGLSPVTSPAPGGEMHAQGGAEAADPLAVGSLVSGIVAIVLATFGCAMFPCVGGLGIFSAIPAVITGHMALGKIKRGAAPGSGRGLATAGLIMGYATLGLVVVGIVLAVLGIGLAAAIGDAAQNGGAQNPL